MGDGDQRIDHVSPALRRDVLLLQASRGNNAGPSRALGPAR